MDETASYLAPGDICLSAWNSNDGVVVSGAPVRRRLEKAWITRGYRAECLLPRAWAVAGFAAPIRSQKRSDKFSIYPILGRERRAAAVKTAGTVSRSPRVVCRSIGASFTGRLLPRPMTRTGRRTMCPRPGSISRRVADADLKTVSEPAGRPPNSPSPSTC